MKRVYRDSAEPPRVGPVSFLQHSFCEQAGGPLPVRISRLCVYSPCERAGGPLYSRVCVCAFVPACIRAWNAGSELLCSERERKGVRRESESCVWGGVIRRVLAAKVQSQRRRTATVTVTRSAVGVALGAAARELGKAQAKLLAEASGHGIVVVLRVRAAGAPALAAAAPAVLGGVCWPRVGPRQGPTPGRPTPRFRQSQSLWSWARGTSRR
jgi:hypothetical protein